MSRLKRNNRNKINFLFFIKFLLIISKTQSNVIDKDNCPLIDSDCGHQSQQKPQRYQRLFLFSNAVLQITPRIQVPFELTTGVDSGFTIKLPISVKFQSQVELMSDWIKQYLTTKTNSLTKNFNSFSASLTQLLGLLNSRSNATPVENSSAGTSDRTHTTGSSAGDRTHTTGTDPTLTARNPTESDINVDNVGRTDSHKTIVQNQFANESRAQARNILFKSIEMSHFTLGKACLKRAICEVSQTPLIAPNTGLIGQIIDMFLTINPLHESLTNFDDYSTAQAVGQSSFAKQSGIWKKNYTFFDECRSQYGQDCPFSLFNINHLIPLSV